MLNRVYIIVGLLAIIVLGAAFVVPLMVDWSSYRDRMQIIATDALGTPVSIKGDLDFSLLPQPRLRFDNVVVGEEGAVIAQIASARAEFSLMDFLRDRYSLTNLVLQSPRLFLHIDKNGELVTLLDLPETVSNSNVSIENADILDGMLELHDDRSGEVLQFNGFDGKLTLAGLRGPFSLQGSGGFGDDSYNIRINTSSMNADAEMQLGIFLAPQDSAFLLKMDGIFKANALPEFNGKVELRYAAPKLSVGKGELDNFGVRGDLVFNSGVETSLKQVLFTDYTIVPDENRPATRLSGAASISLGERREFNAVISAGVVALGVHERTLGDVAGPMGLVRLLADLPMPIVPPMAGRIGIDISELDLGIFSLRDVRVDAAAEEGNWLIEEFSAKMSGDTALALNGTLSRQNEKPVFDGKMALTSQRVDALSLMWRRADVGNVLFNIEASLAGKLHLGQDKFALTDAAFIFDNVENTLSLGIDLSTGPSLAITAGLGDLSERQSRAFMELLPDVGDGTSFDATFSSGSFDLTSRAMILMDLPATEIVASGSWSGDEIYFSRLAMKNIGGARIDVSGSLKNDASGPLVWGEGQLSFSQSSREEALRAVFDRFRTARGIREYAMKSLPAELAFKLQKPDENDAQLLTIRGRAGVGELDLSLAMDNGPFRFAHAPLNGSIELTSAQPLLLGRQIGFGDIGLIPEDNLMRVSVKLDGTPMNSIGIAGTIEGGGNSAGFTGNLIVTDPDRWRGNGTLEINSDEILPYLDLAGISDVGYVPFSGSAQLRFNGVDDISLSAIEGNVERVLVSGDLNRTIVGNDMAFSGSLRASGVEISGLAKLLGGPASVIWGDNIWPVGPFSTVDGVKNSRGKVRVETPFIRHGGRDLASTAVFDFVWDENKRRLSGLKAQLGGGTVDVDVGICCAGSLPERQISSWVKFRDVDIGAILPAVTAAIVRGRVGGSVRLSGTGDSFADTIDKLAGEGSLNITDLEIDQLDPAAFFAISAHEDILELDTEALMSMVEFALKNGTFTAAKTSAVLSVAGGVVRMSNVAAQGEVGRLFGNLRLSLFDMELAGKWKLTPVLVDASSKLISEANALVSILLSGTLFAPEQTLDLGQMIDGIKVRAFELEVDRLEKLRAEAEARAMMAAEERARLMEENARILAEQAQAEADRLAKIEADRLAQIEAERIAAEALTLPENNLDITNGAYDPLTDGEAPIDLLPGNFQPGDFSLPLQSYE